MVILITGASYTGKTMYAQNLLEMHHFPYLSIDHLKMGLIRSGHCLLTPTSDSDELTAYLWPIVKEMIKTAIENNQDLIVEGCYVPFDYQKDFEDDYLKEIDFRCLVFSEKYIENHFEDILKYASIIETRDDDLPDKEQVISQNKLNLESCIEYKLKYILIEDKYELEMR